MSSNYYENNREKISQRQKDYYQRNKERIKERQRIKYNLLTEEEKQKRHLSNKNYKHLHSLSVKGWRDKWLLKNPEWSMYKNAKRRAKDFNIPFDISFKDIIIPTTCPVFGIELKVAAGPNGGSSEFSPSLDRIIPELGYVKGNIQVVSSKANRMKSNATLAELRALVSYLENHTQ